MGRPYKNEVRSLPDTYQWTVALDSEPLKRLFSSHVGKSLIAIGSGGSFSTASVAVALHRHYHRSPGYAVTPLELEASSIVESSCSLWLFSGSGRNIDIRRAVKGASSEFNQLTIVCGKKNSPLEIDARKAFVDRIFSFDTELGKDGYLATNSLFASSIVLASAFSSLPGSLSALTDQAMSGGQTEESIRGSLYSAAENRSNAIILHGPSGRAGALDLESKFTEGAIIASSVADYRNFAHGRHNWINRFGNQSFVVAFVGPGEESLATTTLDLIPVEIPRIVVPLGTDFAIAQTLSLYFAIQIAGWLGDMQGIDPGRPTIPEFGRKLYHLRSRLAANDKRRTPRQVIIDRKVRAGGSKQASDDQLKIWSRHYTNYRRRLNCAEIRAIIFDYDGTLVDTKDRFDPPRLEIISAIDQLLEQGLPIGIATGRGKSLRQELRNALPKDRWDLVTVGYNNASQIAPLTEDLLVDGEVKDEALSEFRNRLIEHTSLTEQMTIRSYPMQLSLRVPDIENIQLLWNEIRAISEEVAGEKLKILISGHSLDVIPERVSKVDLVANLAEKHEIEQSSILTIGDSGNWPGNDAELLRQPISLSVDRVSADPHTCWNLLPPRCRGVDGVMYYLKHLEIVKGRVRIKL